MMKSKLKSGLMKSKVKQIAVSFALMMLINILLSQTLFWELGIESPHVGMLFVVGLLFGPYGAIGAVSANIILDLLNGFTPLEIVPSALFSFGISYLAYKLWYSGFKTNKITKPEMDNFYHLNLFLISIVICGFIYSVIHGNLIGIIFGQDIQTYYTISYFLNFINVAFIFGIIIVLLSNRISFIETHCHIFSIFIRFNNC